jgi:hypothetical protein
VEEALVARSVLKLIADDLRSVIVAGNDDLSAGWETPTPRAAGRSSGGGSDEDGQEDSGTGDSDGGDSDGGSTDEASSPQGGSTAGGTGTGRPRGNAGGSGGSADRGSSNDSSSDPSDGEPATSGLQTGNQNVKPGLYGTADEIQIDTVAGALMGTVPTVSMGTTVSGSQSTTGRSDDPSTPADGGLSGSAPLTPAGIVTHVYLVDAIGGGPVSDSGSGIRRGLLRRTYSRDQSRFAGTSTGAVPVPISERLLAVEVESLALRYFDGLEWIDYWDSSQQQGLPVLVEIAVSIRPGAAESTASGPVDGGATSNPSGQPLRIYRFLVDLPTAIRSGGLAASDTTEEMP